MRPPRAAFVDLPLGHTTGRPHDRPQQRAIVGAALRCFGSLDGPGSIVDLGVSWGDDDWRANPLLGASAVAGGGAAAPGRATPLGADARGERRDTPQYERADDQRLAEERVGVDAACRACVGFDA
ncbi:MAG: hypothetical protein IPM45_03705 [Acidimicrobiales bacterium]|nr:hypothetical protein [Acidimicrobiales bacterium]